MKRSSFIKSGLYAFVAAPSLVLKDKKQVLPAYALHQKFVVDASKPIELYLDNSKVIWKHCHITLINTKKSKVDLNFDTNVVKFISITDCVFFYKS